MDSLTVTERIINANIGALYGVYATVLFENQVNWNCRHVKNTNGQKHFSVQAFPDLRIVKILSGGGFFGVNKRTCLDWGNNVINNLVNMLWTF